MAQITIRNIDDAVIQALRRRASAAGRSMEEEARRSLAIATGVDRDAARTRLASVRAALGEHADRPVEDLVRESREQRTRHLADRFDP
jgi:antitoxin FitA